MEEDRKVEQLRTIEQGGRTYDEYVQEFKKIARESSYEGRLLIEEFKRRLNGALRRKLAKAESLLTTIGQWQERVVQLDRNQRQSRVEKRLLGRNVACLERNTQPRSRGYKGGPYGGREGQIIQRAGNNSGGYQRPSVPSQTGPKRDLNAINVDRGRGGDRTCHTCRK